LRSREPLETEGKKKRRKNVDHEKALDSRRLI
jgi:hypothetical protein